MTDIDFEDNQIECAHCGESFYIELTECPHCGRRVYPDEVQDDWEGEGGLSSSPRFGGVLRFILAALLGIFLASFIGLGLYQLLRQVVLSELTGVYVFILIAVVLCLGTFIGGYVALMVSRRYARMMGRLIALSGIGLTLLVTSHEWGSIFATSQIAGTLIVCLLVSAAGIAGVMLAGRALRGQIYEDLFAPPDEADLYHELVVKVGYDTAIADRLIEFERQRQPSASRSQLLRNALWRWERDNR